MREKFFAILMITCFFGLSACGTALIQASGEHLSSRADIDARQVQPTTQTSLSIMPSPTPTPEPVQVTATVFEEIPQAPILMYHRFIPQTGAVSEKYKVTLSEFENHLQVLYDAGYSLVALEDWLRGEIAVPDGRHPLIITIDDLFYADQISLDESGDPAPYSGIGRLWAFSKSHPDFGFHLALFFNFGDKGYANTYTNGNFYITDGWRGDRAEAIAWCIQNGAVPYNHFYEHPNLKYFSTDQILWQLQENDAALRQALDLVGQPELADILPNILALPYGVWPEDQAGKQILYDYQTPEGAPVLAILEANDGDFVRPLHPPFDEPFDPWHVKRLNATWDAVKAIANKAKELPEALTCDLGKMPPDSVDNPNHIALAILKQTRSGICPEGYYSVDRFAFFVHEDQVIQLSP